MPTSDEPPPSPAPTTTPARMPAGIHNAYAFQVGNTISFSIVLGVPMMLFLKQLGASATILGIAAALPPLLNILQVPAAKFVEKIGYRKFVLLGWSARSYLIMGMAAVAFLPSWIDPTTRIVLMLMLLFIYNTSRGISVCGFLPWMTKLVPETIRGQYLSRDQMSGALASVSALLLNSYFLREGSSLVAFGGVFVFSFAAAMVSLYFLRRIPDVPVEVNSYSSGQVPWKEMLFYPPFLKFMIFNIVINSAMSAAGVFWIPMFRDLLHLSSSKCLLIASVGVFISACSLFFLGRVVDRVGSRPVLSLGLTLYVFHFLGWGSAAAGLIPFNWYWIIVIQLAGGFGGSMWGLANTRLLMGTVPAMGRSHFFALFSVIVSIVLGLVPIGWGLVLDTMASWHGHWWTWEWNKYSFLYIVLAVTMLIGQYFLHRLDEPRAMPTDEFMRELLIHTPSRAITRLIFRKPLP